MLGYCLQTGIKRCLCPQTYIAIHPYQELGPGTNHKDLITNISLSEPALPRSWHLDIRAQQGDSELISNPNLFPEKPWLAYPLKNTHSETQRCLCLVQDSEHKAHSKHLCGVFLQCNEMAKWPTDNHWYFWETQLLSAHRWQRSTSYSWTAHENLHSRYWGTASW